VVIIGAGCVRQNGLETVWAIIGLDNILEENFMSV